MVLPRMTPWSATASIVFSRWCSRAGCDEFDDVAGVVVLRVVHTGDARNGRCLFAPSADRAFQRSPMDTWPSTPAVRV
jgi:hypothetical protein